MASGVEAGVRTGRMAAVLDNATTRVYRSLSLCLDHTYVRVSWARQSCMQR